MEQPSNLYEGLEYEFLRIPDGFDFIYTHNQRDLLKIILRTTEKYVGSAVLSGSITVENSENELLVNNVYSYNSNPWFFVDNNSLDKIICFNFAKNTTTIAACRNEEWSSNNAVSFQVIDGNFTLTANSGLYIIDGTGTYDDKQLDAKDYITPKENSRDIMLINAKCFLVTKYEIL